MICRQCYGAKKIMGSGYVQRLCDECEGTGKIAKAMDRLVEATVKAYIDKVEPERFADPVVKVAKKRGRKPRVSAA